MKYLLLCSALILSSVSGGYPTEFANQSADLDLATDGVLRSAFGFGGQKCSANSRVYVEREVKRLTGHTITDVVNQARMAWASYMLIYSDMEIIDLAEACGFGSQSRFYKVFRDHFGMPPARYRRQTRQASSAQESGSFFAIHTSPPGIADS